MVKRFLVVLLVAGCAGLGWSAPASAHVEANNNGVSAVMHVIPDDNPVSGKPTLIAFYFGGVGGFDVRKCGCKLTVGQGGRTVSAVAVTSLAGSGSEGQATVAFHDAGIYDLTLSGKAGKKSFRIPFIIRADTDSGSTNAAGGLNVVFVSLSSLVLLAMAAYYNISTGSRYTPKPKP